MSKGRLGYDKWSIAEIGENFYIAERIVDGKLERHEFSAHCLACAKTDILAKYGGEVDLRGWHMSSCGSFLKSMQEVVDEES